MEGNEVTLPSFLGADSLISSLSLDRESQEALVAVSRLYPVRVSRFYAALIDPTNPRCPIRRQSIPTIHELDGRGVADPLGENDIQKTPSLFKRYPKRALFIVTGECAMFCRFCNRRRLVGKGFDAAESRDASLEYLAHSPDISEVILSGGDPLMLEPDELGFILHRLREMRHIRVIRLSSRMPVVFPEKARAHVKHLRKYGPLWIILHINHPREITGEFDEVVAKLRDSSMSLVSQSVLLRGINDCHHILARLFEGLLERGVKPYYLFQLDDVIGATHFKVRVNTGLEIMRSLRRSCSGLAVPQYALDITGGLGKVPLESTYLGHRQGDTIRLRNLYGKTGRYLDNGEESTCLECGLCRE